MPIVPYSIARSFLFGMDAERAHELTLTTLARVQKTPLIHLFSEPPVSDTYKLAGLTFRNRIGLAAGLDKNGAYIDGLAAMGFGHIEVGTVTPLPQPGNPKPRIFRLPEAGGLINRLGFNNEGLASFVPNVQRARFRERGGILGLNIGKNAATPIERALDDYLRCFESVYPHADYVTVNVSSPNTANLRSLQSDESLEALLTPIMARQEQLARMHGRKVPVFVKIAPDLDETQVKLLAATLLRCGTDGVIATNTTLSRDAVRGLPHGNETGGLSGKPVFEASNRVIAQLRADLGSAFPIIGVGGVFSGQDAQAKIKAGANLVQIYSGLIYQGPGLVTECARSIKRMGSRA